MRYYSVSNSADEKIVGCYPQTSGLFEGYNHDSPNAMENLTSDEFPDFTPDLRFELDEDAKLTDIVSPSNLDFATGLLMNFKSKEIFQKYKLMSHEYYSALLKTRSEDLDYFWLHIVSPYPSSYIDIPNSLFWEILPSQEKVERKFSSITDHEKYFEQSTNQLTIKEVILEESFETENYDLLCFPGVFSGFLMSERLCNAILAVGLTGLKVKEQSFYKKRA